MKKLETPLTKEKIKKLHVGDQILLSGTIYTARDAAHKKLIQLIENDQRLPFDILDEVIYYVGPTPAKENQVFGSGGPTTSGRMDAYAPTLISLGLRSMIGKGYRNTIVKNALVEHTGVYFGAVGGAGALIGHCVKSSEVIAFEELGPEAIRKLEVENLPLVVVNDSYGEDLYELGRSEYLKQINK